MYKFELFCFRILILHLFFSGFIRIYILPSYSNFIYSFPLIIYILLIIIRIFSAKSGIDFLILFYIFGTIIFQIAHFYLNDITLVQLIYGLFLYSFPAILVTFADSKSAHSSYNLFKKVLCFAIYPNLLLTILQTYIPYSVFAKSTSSVEQLTSYGGVSRAFGSFSSPAGFSFFLTFGLALFLADKQLRQSRVGKFHLFCLLLQIPISGSRTAIIQTCLVVIAYFLIGLLKGRLGMADLRFLAFFLFSFIIGAFVFKSQFSALVMRVNLAANTEDTANRIASTITSFSQGGGASIFGNGLGYYANASSLVNSNFFWIENDLQRNVYELGQILGTIFVSLRFAIPIFLVVALALSSEFGSTQALILWSAILPLVTFGQFFGQGTLSLAGWLLIFFASSLSRIRRVTEGISS
jgi:hypothetical protein